MGMENSIIAECRGGAFRLSYACVKTNRYCNVNEYAARSLSYISLLALAIYSASLDASMMIWIRYRNVARVFRMYRDRTVDSVVILVPNVIHAATSSPGNTDVFRKVLDIEPIVSTRVVVESRAECPRDAISVSLYTSCADLETHYILSAVARSIYISACRHDWCKRILDEVDATMWRW